jgi:CRP/FNR family transcriptional regulator, cyclic AMP receptor protein
MLHQALAQHGFASTQLGKGEARVWAPILREVPLFAPLTDRYLRRIASTAWVARVPQGAAVVRENFNATAFYVLLTGTASVSRNGVHLDVLYPGDYFGELGLVDPSPRTATVTADVEIWVMKLDRAAFWKLVEGEATILRELLQGLGARVRRLESERDGIRGFGPAAG